MSSTKSPTPHFSLQHDLFNKSYQVPKKTLTISATGRAFVNNDPHSLTYGNISLKQYLEENGETGAFIIRSILEEQDWSGFESKYSATSTLFTYGYDGFNPMWNKQRNEFATGSQEVLSF